MKVLISLPFDLELQEGGCRYYLYLEYPRILRYEVIENSWNYYDMRGIVIRCGDTSTKIYKDMKVTLWISSLRRRYRCSDVYEFITGEKDSVACNGGLVLWRGEKPQTMGKYIITRVDVIGPRIKALKGTSRKPPL